MSVLDRAIVKAFQRRRESDAAAQSAEVARRALEPAAVVADAVSVRHDHQADVARGEERGTIPETPTADTHHSPLGTRQIIDVANREITAAITSEPPAIPPAAPVVPETYRTAEHSATSEIAPSVPPPIPADTTNRPTAQTWKWPEICEQLDQFTGDGFRQLAKHLQFAAEQGHKVLGFVSSARNAGRTSVLMTLTRILALEGKTEVLLIDADRRHPHLAELSGQDPVQGLREMLHGQCGLPQAVVPMTPGRVSLLPLTDTVSEVEWQTLVVPLRALLKQVRRDYDMILIDAGVMGPETKLADCWLRGGVDAVITISRQLSGKQTQHEVLNWKQIGIESLGVIETFA